MGSRADSEGPFVIALEGPSGAGKSTLSRTIAAERGALLIEEAYDRLTPTPSLAFANPSELLRLEQTLLKEESRRYLEGKGASLEGHPAVMDTGTLGPLQYVAGLVVVGWPVKGVLTQLVRDARELVRRGQLGLVDLEIYVDVPPRTAFERSQRRAPRVEMEFLERHFTVDRVLRPLWRGPWKTGLNSRLVVVPGRGSLSEVVKRVQRAIRPPLPSRESTEFASLRFLRSLLTVRHPGPSGNR